MFAKFNSIGFHFFSSESYRVGWFNKLKLETCCVFLSNNFGFRIRFTNDVIFSGTFIYIHSNIASCYKLHINLIS